MELDILLRTTASPMGELEVTPHGQTRLFQDNQVLLAYAELHQAADAAGIASVAVTRRHPDWLLASTQLQPYEDEHVVLMDRYVAGETATVTVHSSRCHAMSECLTRWNWRPDSLQFFEHSLFDAAIAEALIQSWCRTPVTARKAQCHDVAFKHLLFSGQRLLTVQ